MKKKKLLKSIISFIICLAMVLSFASFGFASELEEDNKQIISSASSNSGDENHDLADTESELGSSSENNEDSNSELSEGKVTTKEPGLIDEHFGDPAYDLPESEAKKFVVPSSDGDTRSQFSDVVFYIKHARTNGYLTATGDGNVIVAPFTGAANQRWDLINESGVFFMLHPQSAGSRYFLDVDGSYNANNSLNTYLQDGTNVKLFNNGNVNYHSSQWLASACYDGSYQILSKMSYVYYGYYYDSSLHKYLTCELGSNNVIQHSSYPITNGSSHWFFEWVSSSNIDYEGYLDEVSSSVIRGWAYDPVAPNFSISVSITITNVSSGNVVLNQTVPANIYRLDLENAGKGNGYHGFNYPIDWSSYPDGTYRVNAYAGGAEELIDSPRFYTVNNSSSPPEPQTPAEYYASLNWAYPLPTSNIIMEAPYGYSTEYGSVFHPGIDLNAIKGTPVYSVDDGVVVAAGTQADTGNKYVIIETNDFVYNDTTLKIRVSYNHLDSYSVSAGQTVSRNQLIAAVGNTATTGYHLHFCVIVANSYTANSSNSVDPELFYPNINFVRDYEP